MQSSYYYYAMGARELEDCTLTGLIFIKLALSIMLSYTESPLMYSWAVKTPELPVRFWRKADTSDDS